MRKYFKQNDNSNIIRFVRYSLNSPYRGLFRSTKTMLGKEND